MNRDNVIKQFEAIRSMPGFAFARANPQKIEGDELAQVRDIYKAVDELLLVCASEIPADYQSTDEDRAAVAEVLQTGVTGGRRRPSEMIGQGPAAAQAVAVVRAALVEFEIPIHGKHCENWNLFVERTKPVVINNGQYL